MTQNNKKIIITGASGFVGKNLVEYLKHYSYNILPISMRSTHWGKELDLSADAIIHLAGKAHDTKNRSDTSEYLKVNTGLTKELFDLFLKSKVNDFFYFSSVKAVADRVEGVLTEDVEGKPITVYGQSKLQAEQYILSQPLTEGKRVFIIRPCMIHGPGNKGNLNLLYNVVKRGIPWPLASYDNERSFLSSDNLNYLLEQMLKNRTIKSGVYNFADDGTLSTNQLIQIIGKTVGVKTPLLKLPKSFINGVARVGSVLHLPLNKERLQKLTESYVVSNTKIKDALRLEKLPVAIDKGLVKTIQSFL